MDTKDFPGGPAVSHDTHQVIDIPPGLDLCALQETVDAAMPSLDQVYSVRISGRFRAVRTWSGSEQEPDITDSSEDASPPNEFNFMDTAGVMVGFRCPRWFKGIKIPGYHLHFLTHDRKEGGHLLSLITGENVRVSLNLAPQFAMSFPGCGGF